ncbi:hypothetical protein [Streptomyces sp. SBT349]|uniref:hypothetical protein n=1 Tax=Streptomyces sp. SBT349 TaxID=1580539 RepID=UPI00066DE150|nr:hypothetical protein [Streptomyces sp. SBT349]
MNGHAELAQIWPRDGRLRLVGRLHGHDPADEKAEWELLLVHREDPARRLRYRAPLEGAAFDVACPVEDLAPERLELPAVWDLYLTRDPEADPAGALRLGRHLDDIEGKKKIMVFPPQSVVRPAGKAAVRPYYTIRDNLSVEVTPAP